jgi:hypothetical protein
MALDANDDSLDEEEALIELEYGSKNQKALQDVFPEEGRLYTADNFVGDCERVLNEAKGCLQLLIVMCLGIMSEDGTCLTTIIKHHS